MAGAGRQYDVVVYGATGFTGKLAMEYLSLQYGCGATAGRSTEPLKWAISGRSQERLEAAKAEVAALGCPAAAEVPAVVADTSSPDAVRQMVKSTKVVLSFAGPFFKYSDPITKVCAQEGTHWVDITGESPWVAKSIRDYGGPAKSSGAKLVHCSGFDSVPSDITAYLTAKAFRDRFGETPSSLSGGVAEMAGGMSGGTLETGRLLMGDPDMKAAAGNPQLLTPEDKKKAEAEVAPDRLAWWKSPASDKWFCPFMMAPVNTRIVRRSVALAPEVFGETDYDEGMECANRVTAGLTAVGMASVMWPMHFSWTRSILYKTVLPAAGQGPARSTMEKGKWAMNGSAINAAGDKKIRCRLEQSYDPGYMGTARMASEIAILLAQGKEEANGLARGGGVFTPALAVGEAFPSRFERMAMKFSTLD